MGAVEDGAGGLGTFPEHPFRQLVLFHFAMQVFGLFPHEAVEVADVAPEAQPHGVEARPQLIELIHARPEFRGRLHVAALDALRGLGEEGDGPADHARVIQDEPAGEEHGQPEDGQVGAAEGLEPLFHPDRKGVRVRRARADGLGQKLDRFRAFREDAGGHVHMDRQLGQRRGMGEGAEGGVLGRLRRIGGAEQRRVGVRHDGAAAVGQAQLKARRGLRRGQAAEQGRQGIVMRR